MKKHITIRAFLAGVLATMLVASMIPTVLAAAGMSIYIYPGISVYIDNQKLEPKDVNGNPVMVFTYNGTTYLPVRAISEALGKTVDWDGKTQSVYISEIPSQETNWMKKLPPYQCNMATIYDGSDLSSTFTVAGVKHTSGVVLASRWQNGAGQVGGYALWNTNGQYGSVTFTVGSLDGNSADQTLKVDLDGSYSTEYKLKWDSPPQTITVPLKYCSTLKLYLNGTDSPRQYAIYDISFDTAAPETSTEPTNSTTPATPSESETPVVSNPTAETVNWMTALPPYQCGLATIYDGSDLSKTFTVAGAKHTSGVVLASRWQNGAGQVGGYALWNTNGKYSSVTFTVGSLDGNSANQTLKVDLDGSYVTEYKLKWDSPPQTITVPLKYCSTLKLYLNSSDSPREYAIYNITFNE